MSQPAAPRRALGAIFLTIFLDLVGFSLVFPLGPALLGHYLGIAGEDSALGTMVRLLGRIVGDGGAATGQPSFAVTALFGGLLGALFSLLQFLTAPLWGRLSDRIGRRPVLLLTLAGSALAYLVWVFAQPFWLFLASRILAGAMAGNLSVASAAIADVTPPERRARGMALVGVAFGLGFVLGPAIGGLSAGVDLVAAFPALAGLGLHPFSAPAAVGFVLALVNLAWVWRAVPETRPERGSAVPSAEGAAPAGALARVASLFRAPEVAVRSANAVYLLFILAFAGMEFSITFLAAERLGYGPTDNAKLFVFLGIILLLVQGVFVRRFAHKVGELKLARVGILASGAAYGLLGIAHSEATFYLGLLAMGIAAGLANPMFSALVSLYSGPSHQGANLGAFRSAGALGRVGGPLVGGILYWVLGSGTLYVVAAGWTLLPLALSFRLPTPAPGPEPTEDSDVPAASL